MGQGGRREKESECRAISWIRTLSVSAAAYCTYQCTELKLWYQHGELTSQRAPLVHPNVKKKKKMVLALNRASATYALSLCVCIACAWIHVQAYDNVSACVCKGLGGGGQSSAAGQLVTQRGQGFFFLLCVVCVFSCSYRDVIYLVTSVREVIQAHRYIHIYFLEPE